VGAEREKFEPEEKERLEPEGDVEGHALKPNIEKPKPGSSEEEEEADVEAHTIVPTIPQP